ncbi:hypothetical protein SAMN05444410_107181 [Hydrobacter penzbergensis]|uniref:DZANK-type domain-containing protein n=1 Tax=Hydrobacter penzbergensis TaxID=1235997 RepID=A0A8X8IGA7_9BACT|nr:hypothetical protein [Hydrobacter penzbergensis]SDW96874.1 hypothetical protein SAMN05444410_107181 [Hydrobacter penzbergensis]
MKTILLSICLAFVLTGFAQQKPAAPAATAPAPATAAAKPKQVQNPAAWACPKCYAITKDGGQCASCKTDKVQLGTYYCAHCMKGTGTKDGKCPACGMATTRMTRKLVAEHTKGAAMKKAA